MWHNFSLLIARLFIEIDNSNTRRNINNICITLYDIIQMNFLLDLYDLRI